MGRRTQRLKILILNLVCVALLLAGGYLGVRNHQLQGLVRDLRETVSQLEQERRDLEEEIARSGRAVKPEDTVATRRLIEKRTSELRELPFKQEVTYKSLERPELHAVLVRLVDEQYTPDQIRRYTRALSAFGLIPEGTDLRALWLGLYGEQVGAFYVPEEHALYTFKDLTLGGGIDRMTLAHELTHALQDQSFDLTKLPLQVKDNDDLALATAALIEGDATVLMTQFYAAEFDRGSLLQDLGAMLQQDTANLRNAPTYLRETMLFPYQHGQKFATALYLRGGMKELSAAFVRPPTSTEQILHPEQFMLNRDEPTAVSLPEREVEGWQVIWENVMGEFGIRVWLMGEMRFAVAQLAAEGWDGDRYQVYEASPQGPTALVWRSVWDTEQDAVEFIDAYQELARKQKFKPTVERDGVYVMVLQSEDASFIEAWQAAGQAAQ